MHSSGLPVLQRYENFHRISFEEATKEAEKAELWYVLTIPGLCAPWSACRKRLWRVDSNVSVRSRPLSLFFGSLHPAPLSA